MSDDITRSVFPDDLATSGPPESSTNGTPTKYPSIAAIGFEIIDELGRGGMGVVYRAFDRRIEREIALKVLHEKYAPDSPTAWRFLEEGKITGQLQHPGIPAVHQIGTLPDRRPYLAMKLIKGQTLGDLLENQSPEERKATNWLAVFEAICQAVGYAHARDVIHRDLKAQNVMVGSFGEVQVMDWGLAKIMSAEPTEVIANPPLEKPQHTEIRSSRDSDGSLTEAGSVMGTLAYMPPEQAGGEIHRIDQRSDVFSLGAILCVILTGKPPYTDKDLETVRLAAIRGDLADAFARLDASGAEPGLISLAKGCLSFKPSDRPVDAGRVASEVAKLRSESEQRACDAELQRAKAEVQTAEQRKRRKVQLALAGCVLIVFSLIGAGLWWFDRQSTQKARTEAENQTQRKIEAVRNRQAIDAGLDRAEAALRKDNPSFGEIDVALTQAEQRLPVEGEDDARLRFANLKRDRDMVARLDAIDVQRWSRSEDTAVFDTQYAKTNYPIALREYGIDVDSETSGVLAEKIRRSLIATQLMASLDAWWGITHDDKVLNLINSLDPNPDRIALRSAFATKDEVGIKELVEKLDGRLVPPSFAQVVGGHRLTPQTHAIRILTAAQTAHPNHFGLAIETALRFSRHQIAEATAYYRVALAIRPTNSLCYNNLAGALLDQQDVERAIGTYEEAIRLDRNYAIAHQNLGMALRIKDPNRAILEFREAVRLDPKNVRMRNNLGNILGDNRDYDGAIAEYREAIRLDPMYVNAYRNLGNTLGNKQDLDGAIKAHLEAVRLDPEHAYGRELLGRAFLAKGEVDEAISAFKEAIRINPKHFSAYRFLGNCQWRKGELDAAIGTFKAAVRVNPKNPGEHVQLAVALQANKDLAGAVVEFKEAIALDSKNADSYFGLGDVLREMGHMDNDAITAYKDAIRIDPSYASAHHHLGIMLADKNDLEPAINHLKEAVRINPNYALAYHNLGNVLIKNRDVDGGIAAYKEAVRCKILWLPTYQSLADQLKQRGEPLAALEVLREGSKMNPAWMTALDTGFRYRSACCATLAGTGQGKDAPPEPERASLRKQARDWLSADLVALKKVFAEAEMSKEPNAKPSLHQLMSKWLDDPALAAVREPEKLKKVPEDERKAWEQFWIEVHNFRDRMSELLPSPKEVR